MCIGDSILIICQVKGKGQTKDEKLRPCQEYLSKWAREFEEIKFTHLGRERNHFDVLVTPASMARIDFGHKTKDEWCGTPYIQPYMLVYGMEALMPLEVELPSLRVLIDFELEELEWEKVKCERLNLISEKRIAAICHHQLYQRRMAKSYNKRIRP
ncbi:hypothetical protein D5086_014298 [Populus alba]|uniref:Uncharacterized protein n=1 Tax=Populus alba TaxID=43335 RepID=A0ACC4BYJ8_POPAL